jgi:Zn-dependent protease
MKWSWKIARIAGIDIYLHATFLLLLFLVGISYWKQQGSIAAVITGIGFILALFFCVVLHEFGHSLTARRYGIQTRDITLLPIGGVASLEKMPDNPRHEINVAIAGPAVNFVIALLLYLYLDIRNLPVTPAGLGSTGDSFLYRLMMVNVFIGAFNLLPAFPMDGGRILRAALAMRMDHAKATTKAARVGQFLAVGMGLFGILYNPFLLLIAVFIWFGASVENRQEQLHSIVSHASIHHAMLKRFHTLSPEDNLARAIELTLSANQKDFPVQYPNGHYEVLHHGDLLKALQEKGEQTPVSSLQLPDLRCVDISMSLSALIEEMQGHPTRMVGVIDTGKLVGLLNLQTIVEMIEIQKAIQQHHTSARR